MSLATPVIEFPLPLKSEDRPLQEALEILRAAMGHIHPLLDLTLVATPAGFGITAAGGAGTALLGRAIVDAAEITLTEVRLIVTGTGTATAHLYDVTNSVSLANTTLATGKSAWGTLAAKSGDRTLELRVIGDGVAAQTIYSAHAQFRTTSFQQ